MHIFAEKIVESTEQSTSEDLESLNVIDCMIFEIGVQLFFSINIIIKFSVDMAHSKRKVEQEWLLTDEAEFSLNSKET